MHRRSAGKTHLEMSTLGCVRGLSLTTGKEWGKLWGVVHHFRANNALRRRGMFSTQVFNLAGCETPCTVVQNYGRLSGTKFRVFNRTARDRPVGNPDMLCGWQAIMPHPSVK